MHVPVDGPMSTGVWTVQIGLGGLLNKQTNQTGHKVEKGWGFGTMVVEGVVGKYDQTHYMYVWNSQINKDS